MPHGHHDHHHDAHGNPSDRTAYIAKLEAPERVAWQKPDEVIALLGVTAGQCVADVGAGPGWFSLRLATAVGAGGTVLAVEVDLPILGVLRDRIAASTTRNIVPVLGLPDDPLLPAASCDLVLVVDTYHHFGDGAATLRRGARALRAGGRIAIIDFHKRELPEGPSIERKVDRADVLADAQRAGLRLVAEHDVLPYQYFLVFAP